MQPLLLWKSNKYYIFRVCVCRLTYPACNAHAPYCHLWSVLLYYIFPHYLTNGTIFGEGKKLLNTTCVFWFSLQLLTETFLILRRIERDMIKMYICLHVLYLLFSSHLNDTLIFPTDFRKILKYQISWKYVPMETGLFHADGRTDTTKLIIAFRNFTNAPKTAEGRKWRNWIKGRKKQISKQINKSIPEKKCVSTRVGTLIVATI